MNRHAHATFDYKATHFAVLSALLSEGIVSSSWVLTDLIVSSSLQIADMF